MNKIKITFIAVALVATSGLISMAFAHGGWGGYGGRMGYGPGYGMGPGMMGYGSGYGMGPGMMGYGSGYGMGPGMMGYGWQGNPGNLSPEVANRLQQARDKFFDETLQLRREIRDKQFALNDALDNDKPDKAKVAELQKQISRLQSNYDQKVLDYQLNVRKIVPEDAGPGAYGYGWGYGGCNY